MVRRRKKHKVHKDFCLFVCFFICLFVLYVFKEVSEVGISWGSATREDPFVSWCPLWMCWHQQTSSYGTRFGHFLPTKRSDCGASLCVFWQVLAAQPSGHWINNTDRKWDVFWVWLASTGLSSSFHLDLEVQPHEVDLAAEGWLLLGASSGHSSSHS